MTFKEQLKVDNRNVFLNPEEFADIHTINGKDMPCSVDNYELLEREKHLKGEHSDGVYKKQLMIFVNAEDFGALPAIGRLVTFDKKSYVVTDAVDESGIYSITMELNKT